jgi:hypothetical protein
MPTTVPNSSWQKKRPLELILATFAIAWQRIRDTLRNFLLRPTVEMARLFQQSLEPVNFSIAAVVPPEGTILE